MERKLSTKGMILDICSMKTRAIQLLELSGDAEYNGKNGESDHLLTF